jgi:LL-diaminopimelate aminotransferase
VIEALKSMGIAVEAPRASFYIWAPCPKGFSSAQFVKKLLEEAQIVVTPGDGFGSFGAGYFRISLTVPDDRLEEAVKRMKKMRFA